MAMLTNQVFKKKSPIAKTSSTLTFVGIAVGSRGKGDADVLC
jgi:hypothetical protein